MTEKPTEGIKRWGFLSGELTTVSGSTLLGIVTEALGFHTAAWAFVGIALVAAVVGAGRAFVSRGKESRIV